MSRLINLTSSSNEVVKRVAKLSSSKKARDEAHVFVAEGRKLVYEAFCNGYKLQTVFVMQGAEENYPELLDSGADIYSVSLRIMEKITESKTPQDVTAIFAYNFKDFGFDGNKYLCLESIQDPGNVGALLRSAAAFGYDGVVLNEQCADIYSSKVLRGSMGAAFRLPVTVTADLSQFVLNMKKNGYKSYAAALTDNSVSPIEESFPDKLLLLIGNEGNGLEPETIAACDAVIKIPMTKGTESLNAAVAGGILMWETSKK